MMKGDILEARISKAYHQKGVPVLVSPLLLRSLNLGQIDIAYLEKNLQKKWVLRIIESKASLFPSTFQMARLRKTQEYLSLILDIESKLEVKFCQKGDHSLSF